MSNTYYDPALSGLPAPPDRQGPVGLPGRPGGMNFAMDEAGGGGYSGFVQPNQQLSRNPMLPQHPLGAYTDSQYEAQDAQLRNQIARQYADVLQRLGYHDEAGNFIQGSVETEANKQQQNIQYGQDLAVEGETRKRQAEGTLFSGVRGREQARAEDPFVRARADLMASVPLTIQQLYEQASGLSNDYVLGQNQLLADAASRRAAGLMVGNGGAGAAGAAVPGAIDPTAGASVAPQLYAAAPNTMAHLGSPGGAPVLEHGPSVPVIYPPAAPQAYTKPRPLDKAQGY